MKNKGNVKKSIRLVVSSPIIILLELIISTTGLIISITNGNIILRILVIIILSISLICTIVYIIIRWFRIRQAKMNIEKNYLEKEEHAGSNTHKFFHRLRDHTTSLENADKITTDILKDKTKDLCNLIDDFYTDFLNDDTINVCIKLFDETTTKNRDYKKWKTYTFVRSNSADTSREENDNQSIELSKNTDYEIIVSNEPQFQDIYCFISENLKKTKEEFIQKYNKEFVCYNPSHNYQSKIIIPIRIKSEYIPKAKDDSSKFSHHIIGFLCVDSEHTYDNVLSDYRYSTFLLSAHYAKAFADSLYHFFDSFLTINSPMNNQHSTKQ